MEIPQKYLDMCRMLSFEDSLRVHGDTMDTYCTFYETFLIQSDRRVLQYLRECSLNIPTTLTYEEYIELESIRQYCVDQLRSLTAEVNKESSAT